MINFFYYVLSFKVNFKFLIVTNAQKLITKVNHLELAASKDKITVPGIAYSETLRPGELGTSELYLGNDQLLIYLNGKKILDHAFSGHQRHQNLG